MGSVYVYLMNTYVLERYLVKNKCYVIFFFSVRCGLFIFGDPSGQLSRTVRRMSVAVPWSFLGNFLFVRWFLFLLFGEGTTCASCPQGQRADFSMPIFFMWLRSLQWSVFSRKIMVCS